VIREPAVAGSFYPADPAILRRDIGVYVKRANVEEIEGQVLGLISPHAGYMYSGQVAAYGMKTLIGKEYDTVVVIAPSHRMYFDGAALLAEGGYRTPLGLVQVDEELVQLLLLQGDMIRSDVRPHIGEHSLEVQIPFIQYVLKDFRLLPLIMGSQDLFSSKKVSEQILSAMRKRPKRYLVVGSSDLSHYYPYFRAVELDGALLKYLEGFDVEGLWREVERGGCEACGVGPIVATMMVAKGLGATHAKVLKYANSGDVTGDKGSVVGYVSCVFF
jgi:AmmeMemoRadiSam system protein B